MTKKSIIYISGPGYSFEHFEPFLSHIHSHFEKIIDLLKIQTPDGQKTTIELYVDACNPDKINAHAKRVSKQDSIYEIRLSAGLSYHVWLASRYVLAGKNYFAWLDKCKIEKKEIRKGS